MEKMNFVEKVVGTMIVCMAACAVTGALSGGAALAFSVRAYMSNDRTHVETAMSIAYFATAALVGAIALGCISTLTIMVWDKVERRIQRRKIAKRLG